ncbi:R-directed D polymerase from mobile element jockey [Daphnia sinensis]|uniref:R-directed D polymerase from mobile element jockey n=1 Tax=Daphnia sinensis TaxID=1820382 RepID=A0AAD5PNT5_9CRUS|nr:R-directed D polymerase from mobile element jockey [Daphnia sinensis]
MDTSNNSLKHPGSFKRFKSHSISSSSSSDSYQALVSTLLLPVIITFPAQNKCFKQLSLKDSKSVLSAISSILPLATTRVGANGDLLVDTQNESSRDSLLQQSSLGDVEIKCVRPNREIEFKKIIFGVSKEDSEEEIVSELSHVGVTKALRLKKRVDDTQIVTEAVILWFNCAPPPSVQIANEFFLTHEPRQRPLLCSNCWLLGHTANRCRQQKRCRICAKSHTQDATNTCIGPKCCRNCNSGRHTSDDKLCPAYRHKQQILNFAQTENLSFLQAKEILTSKNKNHEQAPDSISPRPTNQPPSVHYTPPTGNFSPDPIESKIEALQHEVANLQCEVKSLKDQLVTYTPLVLSKKMQDNISSTAKLYENLKSSLDAIVPAMVRLTPNIPYIEEICRLVRQQQENTTTTPALLSTDAPATNQIVTTPPENTKTSP